MDASFCVRRSWQQRSWMPAALLLFIVVLSLLSLSKADSDSVGKVRKPGQHPQGQKVTRSHQSGNTTTPGPRNPVRNGLTSSAGRNSSSGSASTESQKKRRLIHGSKNAVTITKKEYLKKDWCKTEPFQQIVDEAGCAKKRITNRFCYGQCNSFFIPKTDKEDQDASSFRSCAYCTPKVADWVTVVLRCPNRTPPFKRKRVQIIKQCKCMAVKLD